MISTLLSSVCLVGLMCIAILMIARIISVDEAMKSIGRTLWDTRVHLSGSMSLPEPHLGSHCPSPIVPPVTDSLGGCYRYCHGTDYAWTWNRFL
jgi:hypothetical protein